MADYISAKEVAKKWNISPKRVSVLCRENRIEGAAFVGKMWIIPKFAEKPSDNRRKPPEKQKAEIKPFVKWAGGKSQLLPELCNLLPQCGEGKINKYVEPMVGGGALLFKIISECNFREIYISDVNAELINAYKVVKDSVEQLIEKLEAMQAEYLPADGVKRKTLYYAVRDRFNRLKLSPETSLQKAADFIFLNKTCFNGLYRVNSKGKFNVPIGEYKFPHICDGENLRAVSSALRNVTIVCGDYSLSKQFIDGHTFVYLDPPYRPISRTSCFNFYDESKFGDEEQLRLAKFIDGISATGAKFVLSNSDPRNTDPQDFFFDELFKNYTIKRVEATRMINSKVGGRGKVKELLIYN